MANPFKPIHLHLKHIRSRGVNLFGWQSDFVILTITAKGADGSVIMDTTKVCVCVCVRARVHVLH